MILGFGLDVVEIQRIERILEHHGASSFAAKILHADELLELQRRAASNSHSAAVFLASRFAAKEAGAKALGTGFSSGILPSHFCIVPSPSGQPVMTLHEKAKEKADSLGVSSALVTISHEKAVCAAAVILQ